MIILDVWEYFLLLKVLRNILVMLEVQSISITLELSRLSGLFWKF